MGTLDYLSDNLIELRGPVDIATNTAFGNGSTVTGKLYDTALDTTIVKYVTPTTADIASGGTTMFVQDATPFFPFDVIRVLQDDGNELYLAILVLPGSNQIDFAPALSAPLTEGAIVSRIQIAGTSDYVTVGNWAPWDITFNMEVSLNNGTTQERLVLEINRDVGFCLLDGTIGGESVAGNAVKRKLGVNIAMSSFGTFPTSDPVVGDPAWGFRGVIQSDHAGLQLGMRIRGEITAVDATSGTDLTRKAVSTVINK